MRNYSLNENHRIQYFQVDNQEELTSLLNEMAIWLTNEGVFVNTVSISHDEGGYAGYICTLPDLKINYDEFEYIENYDSLENVDTEGLIFELLDRVVDSEDLTDETLV